MFVSGVFVFALASSWPLLAEDNNSTYKIAVVNMSDVLQRAPQSAAESKKLEEKFADRETALATEQDELNKAEEAFNRDLNLLSSAERVRRENALRIRQRDLKRNREDLREEVRFAKDTALNYLQGVVADAIKAIREQESIDIIFRESDYIVASERVNITGKVLDYLQKRFEEQQAIDGSGNTPNNSGD